MSHSFRQPVGAQPSMPVAQTPLPGRMVAPICTTGSPAVYPMVPNAYGLLSQQPQQYLAQPIVYPQPITNVPNRVPFVSAVPANMPRMFVPVAPVPTGISPAAADPAKLLEEQRKLEKERNFQLQQERLKQFTVSGKKSTINPDNLIDSMFGKIQPKKNSANPSSILPSKTKEMKEVKNNPKSSFERGSEFPLNTTNIPSTFSSTIPTPPPPLPAVKKEIKGLDSMMLECSNLNVPSKAVKFQKKSSVKEMTPSSSHKTTFTASEKARDWRDIKGLDEVFTAPRPRFPDWCDREKVPELYRKVQAMVTNNDLHPPDTNLLFPIFVSSGLPRELLGEIWELVNESGSGQLSVEEMYATLALIAVAQAGYPVRSIDILQKLPSCPVPHLNIFANTSNVSDPNNSPSLASEENAPSEFGFSQPSEQPVHQVVRPTAISIRSHTQPSDSHKEIISAAQKVATWTPFAGSSNTADDEFDDFQSATPTAINYSLGTPTSLNSPASDDDFDDFKQAPCIKAPESSLSSMKLPESSLTIKDQKKVVTEDLLSPEEDKYSVFRTLQQTEDNNQWADFTLSSVSHESPSLFSSDKDFVGTEHSTSLNYPSVLVTETTESNSLFGKSDTNVVNNTQGDEEFGDFVNASTVPSVLPFTATADFADFSNFKQAECEQLSSVLQPDDEFGEFTSCVSASLKPEIGHDFSFHQLKDNISLAESQSVSSLELGTFDGGGGHSGESKSSLSRQGSIPSLDLKSTVFDGTDSEDCAGEIQLSPYVPRNSKSPSPISITKISVSDESETCSTPVGQYFQPSTLPLTDKYSVIRQEKLKDEDHHISCWSRCLESAVNILQNMKKIFNQMSCSSVCNEVISSEEGGNYVKNVIEVYKVICRIGLASKSLGKQTETLLNLLNEADQVWNTLCGFFAGSALMPEDSSFDYSRGVLKPEPENNTKACGLCLLNIDLRSKSFKQEECPKLSYGGRNYHSTCANFWVNCVDPLLPALVLPQLL